MPRPRHRSAKEGNQKPCTCCVAHLGRRQPVFPCQWTGFRCVTVTGRRRWPKTEDQHGEAPEVFAEPHPPELLTCSGRCQARNRSPSWLVDLRDVGEPSARHSHKRSPIMFREPRNPSSCRIREFLATAHSWWLCLSSGRGERSVSQCSCRKPVGVTQTKACPRPNQACSLAYRPCTWTLARPHCPALREAQPGPAAFLWPGFSFLPLSVETSPMKPDTLARQTGSMCSRVASSPAQQSRRHGRGAVRRRCCSPGL
jgi:hypothetical protein